MYCDRDFDKPPRRVEEINKEEPENRLSGLKFSLSLGFKHDSVAVRAYDSGPKGYEPQQIDKRNTRPQTEEKSIPAVWFFKAKEFSVRPAGLEFECLFLDGMPR
ncbi:hypothetical protein HQS1_07010 [Delftia lacustris]|nr:hypothetical protein HQS1_07010 [Delftia lacustris]